MSGRDGGRIRTSLGELYALFLYDLVLEGSQQLPIDAAGVEDLDLPTPGLARVVYDVVPIPAHARAA